MAAGDRAVQRHDLHRVTRDGADVGAALEE